MLRGRVGFLIWFTGRGSIDGFLEMGDIEDRIGLLTPEEREQMDGFVRMKMETSGCKNWN